MKQRTTAYYNAYSGVYQERRLPRSTQFVAGVYVLVVGLSLLLINQGVRANWGRPIAVNQPAQTRLVANTKPLLATDPPGVSTSPAARSDQLTAETSTMSLYGEAVDQAISQNQATSWSVDIYDLDNHVNLYQRNADQPMITASLYKLYAAYGLAQKLPFGQWGDVKVGGKDVRTCVDLMIRVSDNPCGDAIGGYVGWKYIDNQIHAAGFTGTNLNDGGGPTTTAADTTRLMTALTEGRLFDADTTAFLLSSLSRQSYRSGIPAGCSDCTLFNKTGNNSKVTHDTAIIEFGGRRSVVTIMSEGGSYGKIANVMRAIQTVMATPSP
ncbi:MAG: serine hydrolase [Candidatus Saccharimonadales bacterium]